MIIINADDFGRSRTETDPAAMLVRRQRVTSLSAMVFMKDSERAADLASDLDAEIGLHLNFSEHWTGCRAPRWLQAYQESLVAYFKTSRYAVLVYNPLLRRAFKAVCQAELDEFVRLYGRAPAHIDGHRHLHLCANVLIDGVIPPGSNVRRNFTFAPREKGLLNRSYRYLVDACLLRNYAMTDYFISLEDCLNGRGRSLRRVAELAKEASVELMAHPKNASEFKYLDGDEYLEVLGPATKGTYADLPGRSLVRTAHRLLWSVLAGLWQCATI